MGIIKNPNSSPTVGMFLSPTPLMPCLNPWLPPIPCIESDRCVFSSHAIGHPFLLTGTARILSFSLAPPHRPIPRILQILPFEFLRRSSPPRPVLDSSSTSRFHRHTHSNFRSSACDTSAPFVDSLAPSSRLSLFSKNNDSRRHRNPLLPLSPMSSTLWNPILLLFLWNHLFLLNPFLCVRSLLSLNFARSSISLSPLLYPMVCHYSKCSVASAAAVWKSPALLLRHPLLIWPFSLHDRRISYFQCSPLRGWWRFSPLLF